MCSFSHWSMEDVDEQVEHRNSGSMEEEVQDHSTVSTRSDTVWRSSDARLDCPRTVLSLERKRPSLILFSRRNSSREDCRLS